MTAALEVLDPGLLTLVEDLGRPGWAHVGVGRSGAADAGALRLANRLVANDEGAAGLEVLLGGLRLRAVGDVTVALAGAAGPAWLDGRPVGHEAVLELRVGRGAAARHGHLRAADVRRGARRDRRADGAGVPVHGPAGRRSDRHRCAPVTSWLSARRPTGWPVVDLAPVRPCRTGSSCPWCRGRTRTGSRTCSRGCTPASGT